MGLGERPRGLPERARNPGAADTRCKRTAVPCVRRSRGSNGGAARCARPDRGQARTERSRARSGIARTRVAEADLVIRRRPLAASAVFYDISGQQVGGPVQTKLEGERVLPSLNAVVTH